MSTLTPQLRRTIKIVDNQLKSYNKNPSVDGLEFIRDPNNVKKIKFVINCPVDSYWHDQVLTGDIDIPENYPFSPPNVYFTCNLYHPNIYTTGKVCISILNSTQDEFKYFKAEELWTPAIDLETIIVCIWNILLEPNLESPANVDAMKDYRDNIAEFINKTRQKLIFDPTLLKVKEVISTVAPPNENVAEVEKVITVEQE